MSTQIKTWRDRCTSFCAQYMTGEAQKAIAEEIADLRAELARRDALAHTTELAEQALERVKASGAEFTPEWAASVIAGKAHVPAVVSEGQAVAGYVLVPLEPTPRMIGAGIEAYNGKCEESYRAMLAARPAAPAPDALDWPHVVGRHELSATLANAAPAPEAPTAAPSARTLSDIANMLEGYAESYEAMARQNPSDPTVECRSVACDIRQNMKAYVLAAKAAPTAAQAPEVATGWTRAIAQEERACRAEDALLYLVNQIRKTSPVDDHGHSTLTNMAYIKAVDLLGTLIADGSLPRSALATQPKAAPVAEAPTETKPEASDWRVGNLMTLSDSDYPGMGAMFAQIWQGDDLIARVYGADTEEVRARSKRIAAPATEQAKVEEQEVWIAFNSVDDDEPVMFFTKLPGHELKSRFYLRHFFMRPAGITKEPK